MLEKLNKKDQKEEDKEGEQPVGVTAKGEEVKVEETPKETPKGNAAEEMLKA